MTWTHGSEASCASVFSSAKWHSSTYLMGLRAEQGQNCEVTLPRCVERRLRRDKQKRKTQESHGSCPGAGRRSE